MGKLDLLLMILRVGLQLQIAFLEIVSTVCFFRGIALKKEERISNDLAKPKQQISKINLGKNQ